MSDDDPPRAAVQQHPDTLWFDHNCHVHTAEPCEGCGAMVRYSLGRDWRRDWFLLAAAVNHRGEDCENCETHWVRHTPELCREVRDRVVTTYYGREIVTRSR